MNFSAYSIRNPIPAILLFMLVSVMGIMAFKSNKIQDYPDLELPTVVVSASLPGASPQQLESEVAHKIEDVVAPLIKRKNTYTRIKDGLVTVTVEFQLDKPLGEAITDVRDVVTAIRPELPAEMEDPVISKVETAGKPISTYLIDNVSKPTAATARAAGNPVTTYIIEPGKRVGEHTKTLSAQELSWFIDNTIYKRLLTQSGIGNVRRLGGETREIRVELDPEKMSSLQVSPLEVSRRLKQVQQERPSGNMQIGGEDQVIRTIGTVKTIDEIGRLDIPLNDGRHIQLNQVANVTDNIVQKRSTMRYNGKEVIGFEVFRSRGSGEVDAAAIASEVLEKIQAQHPEIEITQILNNAKAIKENFNGSMAMLYEGALLAVLVVWWFLRDWRSMIVAITALPMSIIPTFLALKYFGYSLNIVTLTSMALVVGVLVDDAIVEIENIHRHLRMGKSPFQAAMEAADEIGMAVVATTLTLVAVFLPIAFMKGVTGLFFQLAGWTIVIAVLASLVVARLLTPMMSAYILHPSKEHGDKESKALHWYLSAVKWCLHNRLLTLLVSLFLFGGSLYLGKFIPTGFVPPSDRNVTLVNVQLPPGSPLSATEAVAERARLAIMQVPHVKDVVSSVGGGASGDVFAPGQLPDASIAVLTIVTTDRADRNLKLTDIEALIRDKVKVIPGALFSVGQSDLGIKMLLVLQSDDDNFANLSLAANRVLRQIKTIDGIGFASSKANYTRKEIIVTPDPIKAALYGVTPDSIGDTIRVATSGDYDSALSKFNVTERQIPIRVIYPASFREDPAAIENLIVFGAKGPIRLGNVANVSIEEGPSQLDHINRKKTITIEIEVGQYTLGQVNNKVRALPAVRALPSGVSISEIGDAKEMNELFNNFASAMAVGILCIYIILVLLYKDFFQPVTILASLPLSVGGAFLALLLTHKSLSMPSLIGLVMLMGIVTKNSILLVDYTLIARRAGATRVEALIDSCRKRVRPIMMTSIAMGAGMMPTALGLGADPSFRSPMAITVIGGLVTSTLLSLIVIPIAFTFMDDFQSWAKKWWDKSQQHNQIPRA